MNKFMIGHVVIAKDISKFMFHSGSGMYSHAIVVSLDPLILVSEQGDMRWSLVNPDDIAPIGRADDKTVQRCMKRLER